ncbi:MAG TPA: methylenetetrahydrofolate--tRNA-(uracil(54)-C(5))-methyltransferase (FADH(2)-oxidizing) TrmFO [Firmicutes bacterium]|nr:methylenetetrahydrofolate--tRNA-(uracil(54)-C(5))-methyltransferase (FADH(2)-oxidizing) TrmFO [Bacillota bacterium]
MSRNKLVVIGGGLAGVEAAWQAARHGIEVDLLEMRPGTMTPAHRTGWLAELVCSNSLGSDMPTTAGGTLKEEMRLLGSLILECASKARVGAGSALAVDRELFARLVTERVEQHERINVIRQESCSIPGGVPVVVATGPLTSPCMAKEISLLTGAEYLYFYDAVAPIITRESIDESKVFWAARYGKGEADYANCPMDEEEYQRFWKALVEAEVVPTREFEPLTLFEGCMPIEEMARRGREALAFGPLRPVGLKDPGTGRRPYAVVQLRKEDPGGTLLNMVGFQTRLKWHEQRRVFRMIPGLEEAEFVRYGVMHRNTFINSPRVLKNTLQVKSHPNILFAGQITGVEGYTESAATGIVAGIQAARIILGQGAIEFPRETIIGSLCHYISTADPEHFQPMNANFGLLQPIDGPRGKMERRLALSSRALSVMRKFVEIVESGL